MRPIVNSPFMYDLAFSWIYLYSEIVKVYPYYSFDQPQLAFESRWGAILGRKSKIYGTLIFLMTDHPEER